MLSTPISIKCIFRHKTGRATMTNDINLFGGLFDNYRRIAFPSGKTRGVHQQNRCHKQNVDLNAKFHIARDPVFLARPQTIVLHHIFRPVSSSEYSILLGSNQNILNQRPPAEPGVWGRPLEGAVETCSADSRWFVKRIFASCSFRSDKMAISTYDKFILSSLVSDLTFLIISFAACISEGVEKINQNSFDCLPS